MSRLDRLLRSLVESGRVDAVVARVRDGEGREWQGRAGRLDPGQSAPLPATARFDLASLTKPLTATLALVLDRRGALPLDTELGTLFSQTHPRLAPITLEALLRHRARLRPWAPLDRFGRERDEVLDRLLAGDLLGARLGTYSDLGFILYTLAAERLLGRPAAELLEELVLAPLEMKRTTPPPGDRRDVVACRLDNGTEVRLAAELGIRLRRRPPPRRGEVQDRNARFLGGLAGHAGLFSTAGDLSLLAGEWLEPSRLLTRGQVEQALGGGGRYALGWWRRTLRGSGGPALSSAALGHAGFVGGSLWLDPLRGAGFVLLAHRSSLAVDLTPARRRFHRLAVDALTAGGDDRGPR